MSDVRVRVRRPNPPSIFQEDEPVGFAVTVPTDPTCIIGIDPSLSVTGVAVLRDAHILNSNFASKKLRGVERLAWFRTQLEGLFKTYRPAMVVIEGYSYGAVNAREVLGELGGVVRLACYDAGVPFRVVPPQSLKLFASGKGNCPKDNVSKELYKRYGVDLSENNEVDAAGLAIMGLAMVHEGFPLTEFQRRALAKIEE